MDGTTLVLYWIFKDITKVHFGVKITIYFFHFGPKKYTGSHKKNACYVKKVRVLSLNNFTLSIGICASKIFLRLDQILGWRFCWYKKRV